LTVSLHEDHIYVICVHNGDLFCIRC